MMSLFLALVFVLAVGGCKDTERPLSYNKGTYSGAADTKLNAGQIEALRQRGMRVYQ
jgi:uncharacterized protein (DUF779 family)